MKPVENSKLPKIVVIVGPTASGKTDLAIKIAEYLSNPSRIGSNKSRTKKFENDSNLLEKDSRVGNSRNIRAINTEIVSADSRQVYKGLDIGAGKVTKKEMRGIPHHLLDVASPRYRFTAAQYQKLASKTIKNILKRGNMPIVCGGTGLYVNSVLYGNYFPPVSPAPALRAKLEKKTTAELFDQLKKLDPERAANIDSCNKVRLVRALEIILETGAPVPKLSAQKKIYNALELGIKISPLKLRSRIHRRLLKRMKIGMVAEAKKLHLAGLSFRRMEELGLEYRYLARYLQKKLSKEEMLSELEKESWRYAKRQMTWFRKDKDIEWVKNENEAFALVKKFLAKR